MSQNQKRTINVSPNVRVEVGKDGSKNIYMKSSKKHVGNQPMYHGGQAGFPSKVVQSSFVIKDSVFDQVAIGNKGPTTFNSKVENFNKGAVKENYDISGGQFVGSTIGGSAVYKNKNTQLQAGSGAGTVKKRWDYDVEAVVLSILKKGITTEQLLKALLKGMKLEEINKHVTSWDADKVEILFNSMLECSDMEI